MGASQILATQYAQIKATGMYGIEQNLGSIEPTFSSFSFR